MPKIAVLTDSCASLPEFLFKELKIHMVAYYIHRGQEVLRDLVTIQREEFLRWLATTKILPTTASPGPGDYFQAYDMLVKERGAKEIISIHMTSTGSGAYQAAKIAQSMAQEQMPDVRIDVIDTRNTSMCTGWMVIEAARAALAEVNFDTILDLIKKKMIPVTRMIMTADTLKYLYMGGRIGLAKSMLGNLLNIKPLIGMTDGVIVPLGQARSRSRAYQMMVDMIVAAVGPLGKIKIAYTHAGAREEVEKIKSLVEKRLTCVETIISELSPALAVHTGPGTAGLCYYPVED